MLEQKLRNILQGRGLKATTQRMIILDYLMSHKNHPTAEMIHADLQSISLATIYNTLEKLVDTGLVIVIDSSDDKRHFDYYGEPHYHIINQKTHEIIDANNFDVQPLLDAARKASGLNISGYHIELYGIDPKDAK
ncbi:Fur family transcriptional regulator [Weissella paramesenteroides]|uniref:Fur family transcriptional regulator n=1 Tax=Weissella paramesenteroides TaxID=1249 RepID=UPI0020746846|nr:Fur family transcriptional regulator [Weissella paramesenteroides]MCM6765544.1 transcriptional repressor [Weissella paramesenteroides]MCM6766915.1 transcriptional repressor [Weissella paramesenteroides]MCM6769316.1 transcriptional repressor [Weissella paramesenteroides]MCM6771321.1 transcriptional repressor [Weissella paramesenteroides]MCM6779586.1 transcriptional repressor [Weissella paramesenteroides]